jgi:hypothetical protein
MSRRGVFNESRQCSDGPVGRGSPFIDRSRMGTFRGDVRLRYDLEPTPEGTALHHMGESTLFGVFRVMKPDGPYHRPW